jgi:uncharacterized protein YbcI
MEDLAREHSLSDDTAVQSNPEELTGSELADVSTALVKLYRRFYGRGPTRAKTTADGDTLTTVLADNFTTVEQTLIEHDRAELVVKVRTVFQEAMRHEFIAAVEIVTRRRVRGFTSGVDVDNDIATETFVLEPRGAPVVGPSASLRKADPGLRAEVLDQARATREPATG